MIAVKPNYSGKVRVLTGLLDGVHHVFNSSYARGNTVPIDLPPATTEVHIKLKSNRDLFDRIKGLTTGLVAKSQDLTWIVQNDGALLVNKDIVEWTKQCEELQAALHTCISEIAITKRDVLEHISKCKRETE